MKYKALFQLALKVLGIYWATQGTLAMLNHVPWIDYSFSMASARPWTSVVPVVAAFLQMGLGLYLFFGGRWIVNLAIPSNRPYCPECAYDLTGAVEPRCPECGTPFRWEDVRPKGEAPTPESK